MRFGALLFLIAGVSSAQVQSAADVAAGVYTTTLAPGSLAVINYAGASPPPASATVSLLPAGSSTLMAAQVTAVTQYSITFVVPPGAPTGAAQLIYKPAGQATQWIPITIVPAQFALFRSGTTGPLTAQNIPANGTPVPNGLATPAQPGEAVTVWGTGLGATPQSAIAVTLGGVAQTRLYAGGAPGQPGLNQINFQVATGTPDGCYVPLTVTYGTQSVTSFLSKTSDGQPCHHPFQLSTAALQQLDSGAPIETGEIVLETGIQAASVTQASRQESAQITGNFLSPAAVAGYFFSPPQACASTTSTAAIAPVIIGYFDPSTLGSMTVANGTSNLTLPWTGSPAGDSPLNSLPVPVLAAGNWTWTASGGLMLSASSFNFALPPPVQITAGVPVTINHSESQTIFWNGSGYDSNAVAHVSLANSYATPGMTCSVPAQAGSVTFPSNLLAQFNAGSEGVLSLIVSETGAGIPHAQFSASGGIPLLMLVTWSSTDSRPVDFQ